MNDYFFIYPSYLTPAPTPGQHIRIEESPSSRTINDETTDTFYNPIVIENLEKYFHHVLLNTPYKDLLTILVEELQQHAEKAYSLQKWYDTQYYDGDRNFYFERLKMLLKIVGLPDLKSEINSILYIKKYNEDFSTNEYSTENIDILVMWLQNLIRAVPIMKKYRGTNLALKLIGATIHRNTTITIANLYISPTSFSPLTGKYYKLTDFFKKVATINSFYRLIPNSPISKFPYSVKITGCEDFALVISSLKNKYDEFKNYDDRIGTPAVIKWDTGESIGLSAKKIYLELALDTVLKHYNTIGTEECLQDTYYLEYLKSLSLFATNASKDILVGSQISFYAKNTGQYISDRSKQEVNNELYTHPNIKAKFQLFKANWEENFSPEFVRIGEGRWDDGSLNVFVNDLENPLDPSFDVPTNLQKPVAESILGGYETQQLAAHTVISCVFKQQLFKQEVMLNQILTLAQTEFIGDVPVTTIQFPHKYIAEGDAKFEIEIIFTLKGGETTKRYILIEEIFNQETHTFSIEPVLLTDTKLEAKNVTETYLEYAYNLSPDYQQTSSAEYLQFFDFPDGKKVKYDKDAGTISLKLKCNNTSSLRDTSPYHGNGTVSINSQISCTYNLHNKKKFSGSSSSRKNNVYKITECGVFNKLGKMIAYGVFPPIIYDPNEYLLTCNFVLENPS